MNDVNDIFILSYGGLDHLKNTVENAQDVDYRFMKTRFQTL